MLWLMQRREFATSEILSRGRLDGRKQVHPAFRTMAYHTDAAHLAQPGKVDHFRYHHAGYVSSIQSQPDLHGSKANEHFQVIGHVATARTCSHLLQMRPHATGKRWPRFGSDEERNNRHVHSVEHQGELPMPIAP